MNGKLSELRRDEEGGKYYELKFLLLTLDFFNYNISLAKRDPESRVKVDLLIQTLPNVREMRRAFDKYFFHKDVSNLKLLKHE